MPPASGTSQGLGPSRACDLSGSFQLQGNQARGQEGGRCAHCSWTQAP